MILILPWSFFNMGSAPLVVNGELLAEFNIYPALDTEVNVFPALSAKVKL